MKEIRLNRNTLFIILVVFFMSLGSIGTVALANYTNVTVEASVVNVRLGPGLSYDIMTQVEGGTVVNVLAEENEWYKVRMDDGRIGWIASWLIDNTEVAASQNLVATIIDPSVNIRMENNSESEIVGSAVAGEQFDLLYEENGWSQIYYQNRVGWVLSELVEIAPGTVAITEEEPVETETVASDETQNVTITFSNVNVRSGPSLEDEILFSTDINESYPYVGEQGDFYEIQVSENETGFVANWLAEADNSSEVENTAPTVNTTLSEATIIIDPGHGGTDPGAVGDYLYEKEVTLETSLKVAERLEKEGANVILTRQGDESISLEERAYLSNNNYADIFISIHYDSTPEGVEATGVTTYYYDDSDSPLADLVNDKLTQNLPLQNNGTNYGDFLVLRENTQPALLLELGYMNNVNDVYTFDNNNYQDLVAESIYQALAEYFH